MKDNHLDFNNKGMFTYVLLSGGGSLWFSNLLLEFGEMNLGGWKRGITALCSQPHLSMQHGQTLSVASMELGDTLRPLLAGQPQHPKALVVSWTSGRGGQSQNGLLFLHWFLKIQKELRCIGNWKLFLNSLLLPCFAVCRHRNPPL